MFASMKYAFDYKELFALDRRSRVITIGNFDGVHIGHQSILIKARETAESQGMELAVLTFEPHPAELLKPAGPKLRLLRPERKLELLGKCGADLVLAQRFDEVFSKLTAEQFAREVLGESLGARIIIVGENFRFGKDREGDVGILAKLGKSIGFEVSPTSLISQGGIDVSSSRIRKSLMLGNVEEAGALLGRHHEILGTVDKGRGEGQRLGFPTINLKDIEVVVPGPGIYAAFAGIEELEVKKELMAAVYLGDRSTFGYGYSIEAHLLDFHQNVYGKRVSIKFISKVRGDKKFEGEKALVEQIKKDIESVQDILKAKQ